MLHKELTEQDKLKLNKNVYQEVIIAVQIMNWLTHLKENKQFSKIYINMKFINMHKKKIWSISILNIWINSMKTAFISKLVWMNAFQK